MNFSRHGRVLRTALALIFLGAFWPPLEAQPPQADSSSFAARLEAAKNTMPVDPRAALLAAQLVQSELRKSPRSGALNALLAESEWLQGEALLRLNRPDLAAPRVEAGLALLVGKAQRTKLYGDLLLSRGWISKSRANVGQALADYQRAYNIFLAVGERRSRAIALQVIASLYRDAGDFKSALRYDSQSIDVYQGDASFSVATLNNRGNSLRQMGRSQEAASQYRLALTFARKLKSEVLQLSILGNIARAHLEMGDPDGAERALEQGWRLASRGQRESWRPQLLAIGAQIALQRGQLSRAEALIRDSFRGVDLTQTSLPYIEAHQTAFDIFERQRKPLEALAHLKALKRLDDKKASLAASTNTALMAARFDYANQNLQIANLKAEDARRKFELERARAEQQRFVFVGVALVALVVAAMLIAMIVAIRRSRNEVRDANKVLAATNVELERALAARTEFLATTSHEIRTPLNGILGMTQVMLADSALSGALRERLSVVHGAGVTMKALVDDILDVAKIESGNLSLESLAIELPALLTDVSRLWEDQARARGIAFVVALEACPPRVIGDPARVRQIVFNLLSNAMKFTDRGSVTLRAAPDAHGMLEIAVTDTGIGIPAGKLEEIFEAFRQVEAGTTRRYGGTGLGLAICRRLARAMGGDVRVTSAPGAGSTFALILPLVEAGAAPEPVAAVPSAGVLIVDANPIARATLSAVLGTRMSVAACGSLADAIAWLGTSRAGRLLVDEGAVADGAGEGGDLAALAAAAPSVPIILLWKHADDALRARWLGAGATLLIAKPIAGQALAEQVASASVVANASQRLVSHAA